MPANLTHTLCTIANIHTGKAHVGDVSPPLDLRVDRGALTSKENYFTDLLGQSSGFSFSFFRAESKLM